MEKEIRSLRQVGLEYLQYLAILQIWTVWLLRKRRTKLKEELKLAAYYQGTRQSVTDMEPFHAYKIKEDCEKGHKKEWIFIYKVTGNSKAWSIILPRRIRVKQSSSHESHSGIKWGRFLRHPTFSAWRSILMHTEGFPNAFQINDLWNYNP